MGKRSESPKDTDNGPAINKRDICTQMITNTGFGRKEMCGDTGFGRKEMCGETATDGACSDLLIKATTAEVECEPHSGENTNLLGDDTEMTEVSIKTDYKNDFNNRH